ncbi:hypothetical protein ABBQ32_008511 [Trebouxia sp. C0010 RCD-2024]
MSLFTSAPVSGGAAAGDTTTTDFMQALSQPLLIQTPLQLMLQTLFFRSREQGAAVLGAQEQLSLLAAENATLKAKLTEREQAAQLEMKDLRHFCIASQEKDSQRDSVAYKELHQQQQQMMSHLSTVESVASQASDSAQRISLRLEKEFKSRLDTLGAKLHGVDNMLGLQLAVHEMAEMMGMAVPQIPPAAVELAAPEPQAEQAAEASVTAAANGAQPLSSNRPRADSGQPGAASSPPDSPPAELAPAEHAASSETALVVQSQKMLNDGQSAAAHAQRGGSLSKGPAPLSRGDLRSGGVGLLPQLKAQVEALEDKELELRLHVEMLRDDMSLQKKEMQTARADISNAAIVTSTLDGRFQVLDGELRGLSKKLTNHQAARDKDAANKPSSVVPVIMGKPGDKVSGATVADLCVLQDQMRASFQGIQDLQDRLDKSDKHSTWCACHTMPPCAVS